MNYIEDYLVTQNKHFDEKIDGLLHIIETRLDKLHASHLDYAANLDVNTREQANRNVSCPYSNATFTQFKAPYIRDFRNFSGPINDDVKQINDLKGTKDIGLLIKNKTWSNDSKKQLLNAVLDHYSHLHIISLIKQKNILNKQLLSASEHSNFNDIRQKISLIEEQTEQVRTRKDLRIFVPENRTDSSIDWCAISAKLTNTQHDPQDCRLMWSNELHWHINNNLWTRDEDDCLMNAVEKYGKNDWDSVAKELNSNRLPWQCCSRYQQAFANSSSNTAPISEDDSDKIIEVINLCRIGNFVPWNQVMYFIQYHNLVQIRYRWNRLLTETRSNLPWTQNEDILMLRAIERYGDKDWNRIANHIPGRNNKSCRERYWQRLKYDHRAIGNWKPREDRALKELIQRFGTNWSIISLHFPGRNGHQVRNRYETLMKGTIRVGPVRQKRLIRDSDGKLVVFKRTKPPTVLEVESRLTEIFSTYQFVKPTKTLVCRSRQDETIYQTVISTIIRSLRGVEERPDSTFGRVIDSAVRHSIGPRYDLTSPCMSTIRGFKAWKLQQDYLSQFRDESIDIEAIKTSPDYYSMLKLAISLFLWPAILSKVEPVEKDVTKYYIGSIIEKDTKNLYTVREIQKQLTSPPPNQNLT